MKNLITICFIVFNFFNIYGQVFLPDDPIWDDPDQLNVPPPAESHHSEYYDFYLNTILLPGKDNNSPARNINTLGEVPNSSWYTNRHYWHPMDKQTLMRGPNKNKGISFEGTWEIIQGKSQGVTPGFTVKDIDGGVYLIKFDPPDFPELATAAEMICTKFFYVLGYYVPQNFLIRFKPERLVLSPKATTKDALGRKKPLTEMTVKKMLAKAHKDEQGYHRAIASKFLDGKPLGPFLYYGTRPDDANDIYPHEARRELRGLRVFCAWLNHDDARAINSLDLLVNENGKKFVRHHLIDFGSTLGSGSIVIQALRASNEYIIEPKPILKGLFSFGLWIRPWAKIDYPDYPSVGRFEGDFFDPVKWKTEYPNPAFLNCDAEDAFWAAKQVMNFSDDQIRAVVSTGNYSDPDAENYLVETLIKRRDKIGRTYLYFSGGIDKFRVEDGSQLVFDDLLVKYKLEHSIQTRKVTWNEFDNLKNDFGKKLDEKRINTVEIDIPHSDSKYIVATIETPGLGRTQVFLRKFSDQWQLVGIQRK